MKKVSTVAAKPSQKISRQKLTVGLDLGDRNSWYCALDESGQIQLESTCGRMRRHCAGVGSLPGRPIRTHSRTRCRPCDGTKDETVVCSVDREVASVTPAVDGATGSVTANWIVDANFASLTYPNLTLDHGAYSWSAPRSDGYGQHHFQHAIGDRAAIGFVSPKYFAHHELRQQQHFRQLHFRIAPV